MQSEPSNLHSTPDVLCIGFMCHDLLNGKNILGGTASYSSIMLSHLGMKTALLTSVGRDFEFYDTVNSYGIDICNVGSEYTTVFQNIYNEQARVQHIFNRATTLLPRHLPEDWKTTAIVKFCLIADELDYSFLEMFPNALVAATIQGWLRIWDENGKIGTKVIDWSILKNVDIVFMSNEDILGYEYAIDKIAEQVDILVVTHGEDPTIIYHNENTYEYPVYSTSEVDPTGAGDIFASSFLYMYHKSKDIKSAAGFAHAAASFVVEDYGIKIPAISEIQSRFEEYMSSN